MNMIPTDPEEVSEYPDSIKPYFIRPDRMEPCYFVIVYQDGTELHQYEATPDGRFIAHHWPEIDFKAVSELQAWAFVDDARDGISTYMIKKLKIDPEKVIPIFVYKNSIHLTMKRMSRRVTRFGYMNKTTGEQKLWEVKKNHAIYNVRDEL